MFSFPTPSDVFAFVVSVKINYLVLVSVTLFQLYIRIQNFPEKYFLINFSFYEMSLKQKWSTGLPLSVTSPISILMIYYDSNVCLCCVFLLKMNWTVYVNKLWSGKDYFNPFNYICSEQHINAYSNVFNRLVFSVITIAYQLMKVHSDDQ